MNGDEALFERERSQMAKCFEHRLWSRWPALGPPHTSERQVARPYTLQSPDL